MIIVSTGYKFGLFGGTPFSQMFQNGCIELYAGTMPTDPDQPFSQAPIGRITMNGGAYVHGNPANSLVYELHDNGALYKPVNDSWVLSGLASGTATWGRAFGGSDTKQFSRTAGRVLFEVNPADSSGMFMGDPVLVPATQRAVTFFLLGIPPFI